MGDLLIYGAYGYTGTLITREALSRGLSPVLAGRDSDKLDAQAADHGLESRSFSLEDDIAAHLEGIDAVCHCAGPFVHTAEPMVRACLETGTDYLDITGELDVFAQLSDLDIDTRASDAGVTILPGAGFDVVPTDCLAAFLHDRLPAATELALGIDAGSSLSRGTALTALEGIGQGSVIRRNGRLCRVPVAQDRRRIDFGDGPQEAIAIPFGDLVTAAHSTGIETITVYLAVPAAAIPAMQFSNAVRPLLETPPVKHTLTWLAETTATGPTERELAQDTAVVWGEVTDGDHVARARLRTPNPYTLTVDTAVSAAERVLTGTVADGFQTPSTAFGPDFVLECDGTDRTVLK